MDHSGVRIDDRARDNEKGSHLSLSQFLCRSGRQRAGERTSDQPLLALLLQQTMVLVNYIKSLTLAGISSIFVL